MSEKFGKLAWTAAVALGAGSGCSLFVSFDQFTDGEPSALTTDAGEDAGHVLDAGTENADVTENPGNPSGIFLRGLEKHPLVSASSLKLDVPGGTEPGDLLVVAVVSTYTGVNGGGLPDAIPGWKVHRAGGSFPQDCTQGHRILIASRVVQADDPTSIVIDAGQSWPLGGILLSYGGVNSVNPIDNDATMTLTSPPLVAPSVETTTSHTLVLRFLALLTSSGSYTVTPTLLERTGIGTLSVFEGVQDAAGPTGLTTFEPSSAISICYANTATIVLRKK